MSERKLRNSEIAGSSLPTALDERRVLYLDNHLMVVDKPAGMLTQGDATGDLDLHSLAKIYLKEKFNKPGNVFLALVHRLDRPVSGVMVFPRTSKAASRVTEQFKKRTIEKRYVAAVEGRLTERATLIDYLWKDHRMVRVVPKEHPQGLRAELSYSVLAVRGDRTLVDVTLGTGRPHQIRVQLANIGHPIIGDFRYKSQTELDGRNLALHSYCLKLDHPIRQERMGWSAAPPSTWGGLFDEEIAALMENESR